MNVPRYYLRTNPETGIRYMSNAADGALSHNTPLWVPDGEYTALARSHQLFINAVQQVAEDFIPGSNAEAALALDEMRETLQGLIDTARLGGDEAMSTKFKVGDWVRVVDAAATFGDYENGDTATVTEILSDGEELIVVWDNQRFPSQPVRECARCRLVFPEEVELIDANGGREP